MTLYRKSDTWVSAKSADEVLLMNVETGVFLSLNPTGGQLWPLLAEPVSLERLISGLTEAFDVDEATAQADVAAFLTDLEKRGIVTKVSG